jgi:hypothetical protein
MTKRMSVAALAVASSLLVAGGTAAAAGGPGQGASSGGQARCERMAEWIAKRQGIGTAELEARLRQRALARVEAAAKAGRLTEARAQELRERIGAWKLCSAKPKAAAEAWQAKRFHAWALGSMLRRGYEYLDLTGRQVRDQLHAGKSLGEIAAAQQGKSAAGLKAAMLAGIAERLGAAVDKGTLTDERRDALLARYGTLADRLIAGNKQPRP